MSRAQARGWKYFQPRLYLPITTCGGDGLLLACVGSPARATLPSDCAGYNNAVFYYVSSVQELNNVILPRGGVSLPPAALAAAGVILCDSFAREARSAKLKFPLRTQKKALRSSSASEARAGLLRCRFLIIQVCAKLWKLLIKNNKKNLNSRVYFKINILRSKNVSVAACWTAPLVACAGGGSPGGP